MSDSHEPSYYEIALTNRQVFTAFVILLSGVFVAFLSGVWIGRESPVGAQPVAVARAGTEPVEASGQAVKRFSFFGDDGALRPKKGEHPSISPVEAAGEIDSPSRAATKNPSLKPRDASLAPPLSSSLPAPDPRSEAKQERGQGEEGSANQAEGQADTQQASTQRQPDRVPSEPPRRSDLHVIQVFSSPEEGQARVVLDRLTQGGFSAFLSPVPVRGRTMYRVRVGPFADRNRARDVAERLKDRYQLDTWITH